MVENNFDDDDIKELTEKLYVLTTAVNKIIKEIKRQNLRTLQ